MRTTWVALVCVAALGCGDDGGGGGGGGTIDAAPSGPDAKQFLDGPPTMTVMVTVSGTAEEIAASGSTPLAGVTIEAFRNANETTPIGTTTTDAQGNYSLTVATNGEAIDGFLKATKTGYKVTYLYPPYPLMMDFNMASVFMVTQATYDTLSNVADADQMPGNGVVALIVTDGAMPVAGAKISSTPAASPTARYNAMVGNLTLPSATATETFTDGIGYLFNLPPGQVTVSATKTGMTFKSHGVKAWADELTTTVVVP
jgi:hypothetical protein